MKEEKLKPFSHMNKENQNVSYILQTFRARKNISVILHKITEPILNLIHPAHAKLTSFAAMLPYQSTFHSL